MKKVLRIKSSVFLIAVSGMLGLWLAGNAEGQGNLLVNGSFESYAKPRSQWSYPNDGFDTVLVGSTALTGWDVVANYIEYVVGWQGADGVAALDLGGSPAAGALSQTFSSTPGQFYNLSFAMSGNPDHVGEPSLKTMRVCVGDLNQDFSYDTQAEGNTGANMKWRHHGFVFQAASNLTTVTFINMMGPVYTGPALDDVWVTACSTFMESPKQASLQMRVNFVPGKLEQANLKAFLELPVGYSVSNVAASLNICGVDVPFTLNKKGQAVNDFSTIKISRKGSAASTVWQVSAKLKGDWDSVWQNYGLTNATVTAMPITVPVVLSFDTDSPESFCVEKPLTYKATAGKSGTAK